MTARFSIRPLGGSTGRHPAEVTGVSCWCWAAHDGLHLEAAFPAEPVPTGFVWGWGPGVWVRWRTDPHAGDAGAELRRAVPTTGYTGVDVDEATPDLDAEQGPEDRDPPPAVPAVVREPRYLVMPGGLSAEELRGHPMRVLRVSEPDLLFFELFSVAASASAPG